MLKSVIFFLKGVAMGAANVIPGVSGGTIALITGIFERIINAIKNTVSIQSAKLLFSGKLKEWVKHTDIGFVLALGAGIVIAIASLARLLEYLFANYPVYIWAFFFGLVMASVWFVAKTISRRSFDVVLFFIIGTMFAVSLALLKPTGENRDMIYLLVCGAVAACSMILPGLSGSFVLVLMGNYELVMIHAVNEANLKILLPVIAGAGIGLLGFSYVLSWIFRKFRDQTISLLAGFMAGSLLIIWPWKETVWRINESGNFILDRSENQIVEKYIWSFPDSINMEVIMSLMFMLAGVLIIIFTETLAVRKTKKNGRT